MAADPIRLSDYRQAQELRRATTRLVVSRPAYTVQSDPASGRVHICLPGTELALSAADALGFAAAIIRCARHARGSK